MSSFAKSFDKISSDLDIKAYFETNNVDLYNFIKKYIQVDKIIQMHPTSSDVLFDKINEIHSVVFNQSNQLNIIGLSIQNFQESIIASVKNSSNQEFKQLLSDHFNLVQSHLSSPSSLHYILQNFQDKLLNLNTEQMSDFDRKTIGMLSNFQSNILKDLSTTLDSHTIHHKIDTINDTITSLHNNFTGNSSTKGKMTENLLYRNLLKAFPDSDVILTRDQPDSCDIQLKKNGKPTILIDSKHCESSNVRKLDLDKFYEDCKLNNSSGILCNTFGGIANRKHFEIDIQDQRILVFLCNHEFDSTMFLLASRIIYNIYDIIKEKTTDVVNLDPLLFQRLKIEYNFFLQSFHQHLDNIKSNINSLSQLSFNHIDIFFKRHNFSINSLKPFFCSVCATDFSTAKTLSKHMTTKHPNFVQL